MIFFSSGNTAAIPALIVLSILLLFLLTLVCVIRLRRARREASKVTKSEENPSYDTYPHPDPRMEVKDNNAYYSSDYEAGAGRSRTTDNNPYYE